MSLVTLNIPNFISGLSQQADSLRFPSQAEDSVNAYPSLVEGLSKRAPTEHISKLWANATIDVYTGANVIRTDSSSIDKIAVHTINRDLSERYTVLYNPASVTEANGAKPRLRVFTMGGVEKTVHVRGGVESLSSYFSNYTKPSDLKFLSVADYTLILNKQKTVALTNDVTATRAVEAVVYVATANYGTRYVIRLSGSNFATREGSYATGNQTGTTIPYYVPSATEIIKNLRDSLFASAGGEAVFNQAYTLTLILGTVGSSQGGDAPYAFHIKRVDNQPFDIFVSDSQGGSALKAVSKTAQSFVDLPAANVNGFTVKITGEPDYEGDEYWVQYFSGGQTAETGAIYRETVKPGSKYKFDSSTLPLALVRLSNGDFLLTPLDGHTATYNGVSYTAPKWGERLVGDDETNPFPSFVGRKINDILFFRNRLVFLSDENVIMSESGSFFNFWRTTVIQLLDADPVDVATSSTKVSTLTSGIPFFERLVLFSDQTQFSLNTPDNLTAKTVSIQNSTNFASDGTSQPVSIGKNIYFSFSRNNYSGVQEYYINPETQLFDGVDISASVPSYIKGNITKIAGSDNEQIVAFLADGEKNKIYIYKYFFTGSEKLQSSWSSFDLGAHTKILNIDFLDNELFLVVARETAAPPAPVYNPDTSPNTLSVIKEVFLEKIDLESFKKDEASDYQIFLDRKISSSFSGVTRSYNAGTGLTTITLPYTTQTSRIAVITKTDKPKFSVVKIKTNDTTPTIYGTAFLDQGDWLKVRLNGFEYILVPDSSGSWSVDTGVAVAINGGGQMIPLVSGGSYTVTGFITNKDGIQTQYTVGDAVVVDTNLVGPPVVTQPYITSGVGGSVVPVVQTSGYVSSFSLVGDYSTVPLWFGEKYKMEHTLGKINLRAPGSKGNPVVVPSGKLYLRRASLAFDNTKSFQVYVYHEGMSSPFVYSFSSYIIGTEASSVNSNSLRDGVFKFPIMGKNDKVKIKLFNDTPYPCAFLSMDVEAQYVSRSQRAG